MSQLKLKESPSEIPASEFIDSLREEIIAATIDSAQHTMMRMPHISVPENGIATFRRVLDEEIRRIVTVSCIAPERLFVEFRPEDNPTSHQLQRLVTMIIKSLGGREHTEISLILRG